MEWWFIGNLGIHYKGSQGLLAIRVKKKYVVIVPRLLARSSNGSEATCGSLRSATSPIDWSFKIHIINHLFCCAYISNSHSEPSGQSQNLGHGGMGCIAEATALLMKNARPKTWDKEENFIV
jgi:hypothetical protein